MYHNCCILYQKLTYLSLPMVQPIKSNIDFKERSYCHVFSRLRSGSQVVQSRKWQVNSFPDSRIYRRKRKCISYWLITIYIPTNLVCTLYFLMYNDLIRIFFAFKKLGPRHKLTTPTPAAMPMCYMTGSI